MTRYYISKIGWTVLAMILSVNLLFSQEKDTMYIIEDGAITHTIDVNSIDYIVFEKPKGLQKYSGEYISDIDGNEYEMVEIGTQIWMAENLRTTKYNDSSEISIVSNDDDWAAIAPNGSGTLLAAMCYYKQESENESYGALYNWFAVSENDNGGKNICPKGWHVPSDAEWSELEVFLGASQSEVQETGLIDNNVGSQLAGNSTLWEDGDLKLDSTYTQSRFNALPGGTRSDWDGSYSYVGKSAEFWTTSDSDFAYHRGIRHEYTGTFRFASAKGIGMSVRCLKD